MKVWAREQQAEVKVEICSARAQHIQPAPEGGELGATMGSRVQAMDGQISLRQRTEQPYTMMKSRAETKRPCLLYTSPSPRD